MTAGPSYFAPEDARLAVRDCCHDFAIALSRMTGWRLAVLQRLPVGDGFDLSPDPVPVHAYCISPDGLAVDAEGATDVGELLARWKPDGSRKLAAQEIGDERAYAAFMSDGPLAPRERGIEAAVRLIASSPGFLALVETLGSAGPPSGPGR